LLENDDVFMPKFAKHDNFMTNQAKKKSYSGPFHREKAGNVEIPIYKTTNKGKVIYQIHWREGEANALKRINRSDFEKAKAEAQRIATAIHNQRASQLKLDAVDAEAYLACMKLLPEGMTLVEAVKRGVRELTTNPSTAREAYERMMEAKEGEELSASWINSIKTRLKPFLEEFGERQIATISTPQLDAFLQKRDEALRTRNNRRDALVQMFNFARKQGILPRGVKTEAEHTARPKERPKETEIFAIEEIEALFTHALDKHVPYLAIGCFAGIRTEEIRRLRWEDFDWEDKMITIEAKKAKTKATRHVPILPALAHALKAHRRDDGPAIRGKVHDFGSAIAKRAGISWKKNGLRHSFASYRLPILKDPAKVAMEMGNSAEIVFRNYHRLVKPSEAKLFWKIRADKLRK
jgi:integrase